MNDNYDYWLDWQTFGDHFGWKVLAFTGNQLATFKTSGRDLQIDGRQKADIMKGLDYLVNGDH